MNPRPALLLGPALAAALVLPLIPAHGDTFGSGANTFTIDFVTIGNTGNAIDTGGGGGTSSPYGAVGYQYRIGVYEISQAQIDKAKLSDPVALANVVAGAYAGNRPAGNLTWYEMAAWVNWLNTSTGHQAAYDLTWSEMTLSWSMALWAPGNAWSLDGENLYRHKDAYYFLPSEDEWYKAAYHQNDGVTANYWDYATGSNSAPTQELTGGTTPGSAVYDAGAPGGGPSGPAEVQLTGGLSPYGTMGQNGNVAELTESATTAPNDSPTEQRSYRGGVYLNTSASLLPSTQGNTSPTNGLQPNIGFRVASVPEPGTAGLLALGALGLLGRRRGNRAR